MKINTKIFGEVEIADDKIITFDKCINELRAEEA